MEVAPIPENEQQRLAALRALALLDTEPEERFDRVTRLAQRLFDVPIALVSLVDAHRQWFKSRQGIDLTETSREVSFCAHAVASGSVLHVPDATADPRFAANPLVASDPAIRFYAGCPLVEPGGAVVGTLCVIDRRARELSVDDLRSLRDLADMVEREIAALHAAAIDELTGLHNRRGFELVAAKVLAICRRRALPATVVFADLDGLKELNDRYGHERGDEALRAFARIFERTFRASDVVARLGGDEFGLLLSGTASAVDAEARLHRALARHEIDTGVPLAASVGSAPFDPSSDETLDDLLRRADQAMYAQKEQGRSRR